MLIGHAWNLTEFYATRGRRGASVDVLDGITGLLKCVGEFDARGVVRREIAGDAPQAN